MDLLNLTYPVRLRAGVYFDEVFHWLANLWNRLKKKCPWCKEALKGEICACEGGELIVIDDSDEIDLGS